MAEGDLTFVCKTCGKTYNDKKNILIVSKGLRDMAFCNEECLAKKIEVKREKVKLNYLEMALLVAVGVIIGGILVFLAYRTFG